jgi:PAT family beta-lactamase induction signal transducer AmpG
MTRILQKWWLAARVYFDKRTIIMSLLGFSSGFPFLLVFGTLNLWLKDAAVPLSLIGIFSLVKTPYAFKWVWAPIIDRYNLPLFGRLGRRRGWAIFTQLLLFIGILCMAAVDPAQNTMWMAVFAVFVAFASSSQDVVLDAYRIESFKAKEQGAGSAVFVFGYRMGLLFSGAAAIFMASEISWGSVYVVMSFGAIVGMITILCTKEPRQDVKPKKAHGPLKTRIRNFMRTAVVNPFNDFMKRENWKIILLFIFLYKMSDAYVSPMAFPFYDDMGFSKVEIASISKIYGVVATIIGSVIGGVLVARFGLMRSLVICGIFQCVSNLMFSVQAMVGYNIYMLMLTISIENISGGMATTAFVAYLSSLCNVLYTATQYALLSSLMSFARDVFASTSGYMAEYFSWEVFFAITTVMGIPGILMIPLLKEHKSKDCDEKPVKSRSCRASANK